MFSCDKINSHIVHHEVISNKVTEQQQKEAMSREFLRILAYGHGFKVTEPTPDHGVDMTVFPVSIREEPNGGTRYLDSQYKLDFQLKATTNMSIIDENDHIKYDLEVKTYNDLVHRRSEILPLHLLVFVLHSTPPGCIYVTESDLSLLGRGYWYLPEENAVATSNQSSIRITIPKANMIGLRFIHERFEDLGIDV